ncbi:3,4-dihydroxy-2-butanone-4-phosphate synthase [Vulgatibacter incomptus]|uniref:3,4-dihydroxy-2-butanone 4-phosphate synthase n=1 Tax=Vulgatibacter incomptus TaxID=1391653 RepID=A0A0K1PCJ7_9BACT|nr:3,4-dihydroxy-2-butanone-4-phosphate synthase [Vulgatibacter incomptus]AKU91235.1 3,4-dihydroxy-2-butanone 4-phosphate synthase [Vulgatibacter incomptus]
MSNRIGRGPSSNASKKPAGQPKSSPSYLERVERAIADIRDGRMIILVDDEDRENEGDLCMAAEKVTPEAVNFMAKEGRGLICLTLEEDRIKRLNLPMMVTDNESPFQTGFTVSIEAARGVTTGISAHDRAHTILTAVAPEARAEDLVRPGHIFPLRARTGGVLVRTGQTEGSVDLARLAGLEPAGVICEIMNDDGTMARMKDLERFGETHDMVIVSIADLIRYRLERERLVRRVAEDELEVAGVGTFRSIAYQSSGDPRTHIALVQGDVRGLEPVLVRMHGACGMGDVFGSAACECGVNLRRSLARIAEEGRGALVYLQQEGRAGAQALKCARMAPEVEEAMAKKSAGPFRDYGLGAQILADLGIRRLRLLSNNPKKLVGLEGYGLEVVDRLPIEVAEGRRSVAGTGRVAAHRVANSRGTSGKTAKKAARKDRS